MKTSSQGIKHASPVAYDNTDTKSQILDMAEDKQGFVNFDGRWYLATCDGETWIFEVTDDEN
ncbi:MAG: hypothetical protein Q7K43_06265 [Candidatus Woesearchaeota archaeon]|nr:hypothetical protein [Candidatus Woesearchaeota archaeon]